MSELVFRCLVKVYRTGKNACIHFDQICSKRKKIFSLAGIPVYLDYAFFLIALAPALLLGGIILLDELAAKYIGISVVILLVLIFLLALFLSILIHELGHAWFIHKNKLCVDKILISMFYGKCEYWYADDQVPPASIAYGGIIAQSLVVLALFGYTVIAPHETTYQNYNSPEAYFNIFLAHLWVFNVGMIVVNILPFRGLDGEIIWSHLKTLWAKRNRKSRIKVDE